MASRWWAYNGPLLLVIGPSLSSHQLHFCIETLSELNWTPSAKTFWIRAWHSKGAGWSVPLLLACNNVRFSRNSFFLIWCQLIPKILLKYIIHSRCTLDIFTHLSLYCRKSVLFILVLKSATIGKTLNQSSSKEIARNKQFLVNNPGLQN